LKCEIRNGFQYAGHGPRRGSSSSQNLHAMQASQGLCNPNLALPQLFMVNFLTESSCDATPRRGSLHHAQGARLDHCNVSSILISGEHQRESGLFADHIVIGKLSKANKSCRRVEEMAKELEALRSQRHDDGAPGATESPEFPDSSQDSPDHPSELSGIAIIDDSGLGHEPFELEECVIGKDTIVEIFKL
jgi:hypothetical protein